MLVEGERPAGGSLFDMLSNGLAQATTNVVLSNIASAAVALQHVLSVRPLFLK